MAIKLEVTEDQFHHLIRGLEYTMHDYQDEYDSYAKKSNVEAKRYNAFVQRFIDKLIKQYKAQN